MARPKHLLVSGLVAATLLMACSSAAQPAATATTPPRAPGATATSTPQSQPGTAATPSANPTSAPASASATAKPQSGGILKARWYREVASWEIHKRGFLGSPGAMSYNLIFTPLAQRNPTGPCKMAVGPEGAESWKWVNDTTFELKLRSDLKFVDKAPVNGRLATAQDAIWGLQRYRDFQSRGGISMKPIVSMTAVDPMTVRFVTDQPYPALVDSVLANHYGGLLLPKEVEKDGLIDERGWLGTGPFYLKQWVPGVRMLLERNPNYYKKGLPYVDGIDWVLLPDPSTATAAMRAGKIDVWPRDLTYVLAAPFMATDIKVLSCPEVAPSILFMRTDKAPFNDVRVRRALSLAIDRKGLLESVLLGKGTIIGYSVPVHDWLLKFEEYPSEVRRYLEYNPQEAKKLMAEAGYPNGFEVTVEFDPSRGLIYLQNLEGITDMFSRVGVKMRIKALPRGDYQERITNSADFQSMAQSYTMDIDPYFYLSFLHSKAGPGTNKGYIVDPVLDKLIDDFTSTVDMNKAKELAHQIEIRIVDQAYVLRPPAHDDFRLVGPRVRDFAQVDTMTATMALSWAEKLWLAR
ncbi:MAG: ABC transporter substrate-binding protein [Chloroflexi bacterium]|nr:ABC transporter substrate-binding protein [Chloroflexota bacterium]